MLSTALQLPSGSFLFAKTGYGVGGQRDAHGHVCRFSLTCFALVVEARREISLFEYADFLSVLSARTATESLSAPM